jgi:hypothetical protein
MMVLPAATEYAIAAAERALKAARSQPQHALSYMATAAEVLVAGQRWAIATADTVRPKNHCRVIRDSEVARAEAYADKQGASK